MTQGNDCVWMDRRGKAARVGGKSGTNQCFINVLLKNPPTLVPSFSEYSAEPKVQQKSAVPVLMLLCTSSRKELTGECGDSLQALTCPAPTSSPSVPHAAGESQHGHSQQPSRGTER